MGVAESSGIFRSAAVTAVRIPGEPGGEDPKQGVRKVLPGVTGVGNKAGVLTRHNQFGSAPAKRRFSGQSVVRYRRE